MSGCGQEQLIPVRACYHVALAVHNPGPFPLAYLQQFLVLSYTGEAPVAAPLSFCPGTTEGEVLTVLVILFSPHVGCCPACSAWQSEIYVLMSHIAQRVVIQGD